MLRNDVLFPHLFFISPSIEVTVYSSPVYVYTRPHVTMIHEDLGCIHPISDKLRDLF